MVLVYTTAKRTCRMSIGSKKNGFSNVWGNPFSKSQKPKDISEDMEALRVSGMVAEGHACRVIMEKMKTQAPSLFFTENAPGGIGLERTLDVSYFDESDRCVKYLDSEITKKAHFKDMKFEDIDELHRLTLNYSKAKQDPFKSNLIYLLRSIDFLQASHPPSSIEVVLTATTPDKFVGGMNGVIGSNGHRKHFSFSAEKILKATLTIRKEKYVVTVVTNTRDQSAFFRWKHTESKSTVLPKNVHELFLIFPGRPRLTIQLLKHPKLVPGTSIGLATFELALKKLSATIFDTTATEIEENRNDTADFFNRRVPNTRYVPREKENNRAIFDTFPYDSYICHFSRCVHDLARMQYVYTVLYSVTAAMLRDYTGELDKAGDFGKDSVPWTALTAAIRHVIEDRGSPSDLKSNIAFAAALASHVYINICKDTPAGEVSTQLSNLYTTDSGTPPENNQHTPDTFGHLLATYAFENAPLHVVSKPEDRNTVAVKRTRFGDEQKLYIIKLNLGDDNGSYNHGRRWSISAVAGSKRVFFFDLEEIMIPGSKPKKPPTDVQPPSPQYWCKKYDVNAEEHNRYGLSRQSLISINLNSTHEMELRLDVPYTDIKGVELGDKTSAMKFGAGIDDWAADTVEPVVDGADTGEPVRGRTDANQT